MKTKYLKPILFLVCLIPLGRLGWKGYNSALGANPIQVITWSTGTWTLTFLMFTLSVTPIRQLTKQYWLIQYRRMLGLFAFFYGCLHFLTYIWLDQFFDLHSMAKDIVKRPFITVGFSAFVLMIPLALTSNQRAIRWLGKRWQKLHMLIYATAIARRRALHLAGEERHSRTSYLCGHTHSSPALPGGCRSVTAQTIATIGGRVARPRRAQHRGRRLGRSSPNRKTICDIIDMLRTSARASAFVMDERSFQNLLRRTIAVPVALLVLLVVVLGVEVLTLTGSLHRVDHADLVITNARQSMRYMVDMESSARGFELTGDERFLDLFRRSKSLLPASIDALAELTADNPAQQARVHEIRSLDQHWIDWAESETNSYARKKPTDDELLQGDALMEKIRNQQREIVAGEEQLLHLRTRRATYLSRVVLFTAVGLSVMVAGLLFTLTRRELRQLSDTYEKYLHAEAEKSRQLAESRERFQITLNSLGDAVIATDATGKITYINPAAQQLTGWNDYMEAKGRSLGEVARFIDERTRYELTDPVEIVRRAEKVVALTNHVVLIGRSGDEHPIEMNGAPILNDRCQLMGIVLVFRDITQRRQTEQTLRASDRLTQVGRLAATIAHEIRNPLDTVSNLIFLLRHETYPNPETNHYLDLAGEELARITQITGQLLTFHREAQSPVQVDLSKVLESVLTLYAPQIYMSGITVTSRFDTLRPVRGFPGELRQVFANLVVNAIHSMPDGGKIVLHVYESSLTSDAERKGIRVTVLDNGTGIPLGVRKNLFAPFYTTKGEAGTGLGLWVTRGIIEKHEGTIHFTSRVRQGRSGTAFSVFLPFEQTLGKLDLPKVATTA